MPPTRIEFLVRILHGIVDRGGVVRGIDAFEQRDDVGIGVADTEHFEIVFAGGHARREEHTKSASCCRTGRGARGTTIAGPAFFERGNGPET